jgi:hypothetical protein
MMTHGSSTCAGQKNPPDVDPRFVNGKKVFRRTGDEEQREIESLENEIRGLESEIDRDAAKYEECRRIMALGVRSLDAMHQTTKMDALMSKLTILKQKRREAMDKKDAHMVAVCTGDERALVMEDIRDERSKKAVFYPLNVSTRTEEEEMRIRMESKRLMKPRSNSANCPDGCADLVSDEKSCSLLCPTCGHVYQDTRCNPQNPFCTMGKYGEKVDAPRRRSGGYKPPNHFAEIVGHFQGVRNYNASPDILEKLKEYAARYKYETKDITPQVLRFFLRRMQQNENNRHANAVAKNGVKDRLVRYTDFYRSTPEMSYRISGIPPPYMSPMQEDRVLALFPKVIAAYKTSPRYLRRLQQRSYCVKKTTRQRSTAREDNPSYNRKFHGSLDCVKKYPNNPNYSFAFYKICQLLGYDEFLPYIALPKSTDNIDDNDTEAWKHICRVEGWPYIPTR